MDKIFEDAFEEKRKEDNDDVKAFLGCGAIGCALAVGALVILALMLRLFFYVAGF
jgi:hypothetical protein